MRVSCFFSSYSNLVRCRRRSSHGVSKTLNRFAASFRRRGKLDDGRPFIRDNQAPYNNYKQ
jgi:hypothetical protein